MNKLNKIIVDEIYKWFETIGKKEYISIYKGHITADGEIRKKDVKLLANSIISKLPIVIEKDGKETNG